jgi:glycerol uptake facilitator-like aquaporin
MLATTYLVQLTTFATVLLVGGFFAVVLWKIATGEISLAYLLYTKGSDGRLSYSPARLQLLIFTVGVAANYLRGVMANPHVDSLPDLSPSVLVALGGSHAVYLGGKTFSALIQPLLKK